MVKNYYKLLGIPTTASAEEVNQGFKKALLKYHPKKTKVNLPQASRELLEACEAYEVLSTPNLRSVYDAYGYETLSSGIHSQGEVVFPAYKFRSSPEELYKRFMLQANPFAFIVNNTSTQCIGSISGYSETGKNWEIDLTPADIEVSVDCTLEELFFGCTKKIRFYRLDKTDPLGKSLQSRDILIKPGYSEGSKIEYKQEGNQRNNGTKGSLIVKIKEKKHEKFVRKGSDLHVTVSLGLHEALNPEVIHVENIDKTVRCISVDHCINPQYTINIQGQGMPIEGSHERGNLCIHFDVVFPERIPEDRLSELKALLPN